MSDAWIDVATAIAERLADAIARVMRAHGHSVTSQFRESVIANSQAEIEPIIRAAAAPTLAENESRRAWNHPAST